MVQTYTQLVIRSMEIEKQIVFDNNNLASYNNNNNLILILRAFHEMIKRALHDFYL